MKYMWVALAAIVLLLGYGSHQKQIGVLQGEIHARGESIRQLGQLAADKTRAYQQARAAYIAKPTPENCSLVIRNCDEMQTSKDAQIKELNKQIEALTKRGKPSIWSKLPWVAVGFGVCEASNR